MIKKIVVKSYIGALEKIFDCLEIEEVEEGIVNRLPRYKILDTETGSIRRLVDVVVDELDYRVHRNGMFKRTPYERLCASFNEGLRSTQEIKDEIRSLIDAANTLSSNLK